MSDRDAPEPPPPQEGAVTAEEGTAVAVDLSGDRRARVVWVVFLVGPVIWISHFMLVYLVTEAGCNGAGTGFDLLDPPVPAIVTLVTTVIAAAGCGAAAVWGYRWWRGVERGTAAAEARHRAGEPTEQERSGPLAFAGFLLSALSVIAVLFVGLPALVFGSC